MNIRIVLVTIFVLTLLVACGPAARPDRPVAQIKLNNLRPRQSTKMTGPRVTQHPTPRRRPALHRRLPRPEPQSRCQPKNRPTDSRNQPDTRATQSRNQNLRQHPTHCQPLSLLRHCSPRQCHQTASPTVMPSIFFRARPQRWNTQVGAPMSWSRM